MSLEVSVDIRQLYRPRKDQVMTHYFWKTGNGPGGEYDGHADGPKGSLEASRQFSLSIPFFLPFLIFFQFFSF